MLRLLRSRNDARRSRVQEQAQQVGRQSGVLGLRDDIFRVNDDVPSRRYFRTMTTNGLPQTAANTIAHYRAAQSLFDAEAEAAAGQLIGAKENGEVRTGAPASGAIDGVEISAADQARVARKIQPRSIRRA